MDENKSTNKKIIIISVVVIIILSLILAGLIIFAKQRKEKAKNDIQLMPTVPRQTILLTTAQATITTATTTAQKISSPYCKSAAVYCMETEELLYSDNLSEKTAPASLTKLLTALTALKYTKQTDTFPVGSELEMVSPYSSLSSIYYGDEFTMEELITGMLMASGNDAAYTIAVSTARTAAENEWMGDWEAVEYFCGLMNDLADEIGMKNSYFTTPDGWDNDYQYTTAEDMLKLAEYAMKDPLIQQIVGTYKKTVFHYTGESLEWVNSNLLLDHTSDYYCNYAVGMKTGTTLEAGNSLIATFRKNGNTYLTIVEGCETDEDRYELTLKLFSEIIP